MNTDSQWSKQEACFARPTQVWLTVNHTSVSHLVNEFDVQRELHRPPDPGPSSLISLLLEFFSWSSGSVDGWWYGIIRR